MSNEKQTNFKNVLTASITAKINIEINDKLLTQSGKVKNENILKIIDFAVKKQI